MTLLLRFMVGVDLVAFCIPSRMKGSFIKVVFLLVCISEGLTFSKRFHPGSKFLPVSPSMAFNFNQQLLCNVFLLQIRKHDLESQLKDVANVKELRPKVKPFDLKSVITPNCPRCYQSFRQRRPFVPRGFHPRWFQTGRTLPRGFLPTLPERMNLNHLMKDMKMYF